MTAAIKQQIEQPKFSSRETLFGQMLDLIGTQQQTIFALAGENDK